MEWLGKIFFFASIKASIELIRLLHPKTKDILKNDAGRKLLLFQFSTQPKRLSPKVAINELDDYVRSRSFDELLYNLMYGEKQQGLPKNSLKESLVIVWGKNDRVCFPQQAQRALKAFPDAELIWFENCGHFPQWNRTEETIKLILETTMIR